jgi:sugar/nucleoside kinase (ribokinase family)
VSILVVGSIAIDSIQTPFGRVKDAIGGSALYFAAAASLYDQVNFVGVVGEDFPEAEIEFLKHRGVDFGGLQVAPGKTFRWSGRYDYDMNVAKTLDTQLNVFATFHPVLPDNYCDSDFVLLANIDPNLQIEVLDQVRNPKLVALDTMNYWISYEKQALTRAISRADVILMNEAEVRQYGNTMSLIRGARTILELGPRTLIVKKGEYGASMYSNGNNPISSYFFAPAYPLEKVEDPTGAGDAFAGGFMGYLAQNDSLTLGAIKRAVVHGSVVASFVVEEFGIERLRDLTCDEIGGRYEEFKHFTHFDRFAGDDRPSQIKLHELAHKA